MSTSLSSLKLDVQPLATGLDNPVHITNAGDGSDRLFVVEQDGRVRILQDGQLVEEPFLDISGQVGSGGERGLLSIAFSPSYKQTGDVYVNYTNLDGDTVIARYQVSEDSNSVDPSSEEILLTIDQPFSNHNGGQIAFGPDEYLYIGMGDGGGGGDPQDNAQDPTSLLGKMLRIDVESTNGETFAIPTDNPFLADNDPGNTIRDEIWAFGLRNPWRFSFDRKTGNLFIADVGQSNLEEINVQTFKSAGGENYGWRVFEGTSLYEGSDPIPENLVFPVAEYDHSEGQSITGGFVYRGPIQTDLRGAYLYGDFVSGRIWGLERRGDQWKPTLLLDTSFGISSFGEDEAGNLYVADLFEGAIYAIAVPEESSEPLSPIPGATNRSDRLKGTNKDDRIVGLGGSDFLFGQDGDDHIQGGNGKDQLYGDRNDDILQGRKANDALLGGPGTDDLDGGSGDDVLAGGKEIDLLMGGSGRDTFILNSDEGCDRIGDFQPRRDRLSFLERINFDDLTLIQSKQGTLIQIQKTGVAFLHDIQSDQIRPRHVISIDA